MNWLLIIVLLVLVCCAIRGYQKGFLRIAYSLVSWAIVLLFVSWSTPYINHFLLENTTIYETVSLYCEEQIRQSAENQSAEKLSQKKPELAELGIHLPQEVVDNIMKQTVEAADGFLEASGLYKEIAKGIAGFIVRGIAFLAALILAQLLVHIVSRFLGGVSKIPVLHGVNKFLGIFAGSIYGLLLIWVTFCITAMFGASEVGSMMTGCIYESRLLTALYENNLIMTIMLYIL